MRTVTHEAGLFCGRCGQAIDKDKLHCAECCWAVSVEFAACFSWSARFRRLIADRKRLMAARLRKR